LENLSATQITIGTNGGALALGTSDITTAAANGAITLRAGA